ncbi:MAG: hypothetical protein AB7U23_12620 [Dehalococcoidia bacterium]
MTDTPLDLDAIEARANALTPYVDAVENHPMQLRDSRPEVVDLLVAVTLTAQDVPALVAALRDAQAERDEGRTARAALVRVEALRSEATYVDALGSLVVSVDALTAAITGEA